MTQCGPERWKCSTCLNPEFGKHSGFCIAQAAHCFHTRPSMRHISFSSRGHSFRVLAPSRKQGGYNRDPFGNRRAFVTTHPKHDRPSQLLACVQPGVDQRVRPSLRFPELRFFTLQAAQWPRCMKRNDSACSTPPHADSQSPILEKLHTRALNCAAFLKQLYNIGILDINKNQRWGPYS